MNYSRPGFPTFTFSWSLLKLESIESVMPSIRLILCCPLLFLPSNFAIIKVFSRVTFCIRWPKYWSFSFNISSFNEYSGLISLRINPCWPRDSQESSPAPQYESINASVLSILYGPILTHLLDYWKHYSWNYMDFCQQSDISAFQYTKFVIAFFQGASIFYFHLYSHCPQWFWSQGK